MVKPYAVIDIAHARDEAIAIPPGETLYSVDLDEATVTQLADGICPESLAQRMHAILGWKREQQRVDALTHREVKRQQTKRRKTA